LFAPPQKINIKGIKTALLPRHLEEDKDLKEEEGK
jgi:hypothetical protein